MHAPTPTERSCDSFRRLQQAFCALVDLPESQREAYLDSLTDLDADARRQLQDLLQADAQLTRSTVRPAIREDRSGADAASWLGRRIGAYRIERELGRGGMGSVFLAHRVDGGVDQLAAIKIVRPERLDAVTLARFQLERQLLALLRHPNIPTLLDLGELADGSPYVVMEYVDGVAIDRYVREQRLDLRGCLQLFLRVCDAVAHAHRNLVVHRDLKPGNVLVDAQGQPQLLDFGIAKPLQAQVGALHVAETALSDRFLSLSHAAPEQLLGSPITTACDVYGLGVLLYELLTGAPPFAGHAATPSQLEKMICEEDPPPPGERGAASARLRFRRDLDEIVLCCLRKPPQERYASVDQLAEDVRRYLAGRPVAARHGNLLYRSGRFIARHRYAITATTLLALVLLAAVTVVWRQQQSIDSQQQRADDMTALIMGALRSVDPSSDGQAISAREVFERVAGQALSSPELAPASRARVLTAVIEVLLNLGEYSRAERLFEQLRAQPVDAAQRNELDRVHARLLMAMSRLDQAETVVAAGLARRGLSPQEQAEWLLLGARLDYNRNRSATALLKLDAIDARVLQGELEERYRSLRALAYVRTGRGSEGAAQMAQVVQARSQRLGANSPAVFDGLLEQAQLERELGNNAQLDALSERLTQLAAATFGTNSMRYAQALAVRRSAAERRGDRRSAVAYQQEILAIARGQIGPSSDATARAQFVLAAQYQELGDMAQAHVHYTQAVEVAEKAWPEGDANRLLFQAGYAAFLSLNDHAAAARRVLEQGRRELDQHPQLRDYDVALLLGAVEQLERFRAEPRAPQRMALAAALQQAINVADDPYVAAAADKLAAKAGALVTAAGQDLKLRLDTSAQ